MNKLMGYNEPWGVEQEVQFWIDIELHHRRIADTAREKVQNIVLNTKRSGDEEMYLRLKEMTQKEND